MKPIIPKYFLNLIKVARYHSLQQQHKEIFFTQLAFTLVELIVTVAIIGVLAAIAIPAYQDYLDKARTIRAISDIENIGRRLHDYHIDNNNYPASLIEIGADNILDP
ncbi:MAG: prepilin-type N-terminal cleavage/methylation domain-containing protein [Candidatus Nitrotoga sp. LAW]|nr:MAG: prepilin-type N-terminal cleavage/methylation domain-containing protein [Candidatus Nitrotoga sp. LAW]